MLYTVVHLHVRREPLPHGAWRSARFDPVLVTPTAITHFRRFTCSSSLHHIFDSSGTKEKKKKITDSIPSSHELDVDFSRRAGCTVLRLFYVLDSWDRIPCVCAPPCSSWDCAGHAAYRIVASELSMHPFIPRFIDNSLAATSIFILPFSLRSSDRIIRCIPTPCESSPTQAITLIHAPPATKLITILPILRRIYAVSSLAASAPICTPPIPTPYHVAVPHVHPSRYSSLLSGSRRSFACYDIVAVMFVCVFFFFFAFFAFFRFFPCFLAYFFLQ